jgi:alpha-glucuronidase
MRLLCRAVCAVFALCFATMAHAESGYDLWLRYVPIPLQEQGAYRVARLQAFPTSPTLRAAMDELDRGYRGMMGTPLPHERVADGDGNLLVGTPASLPAIAQLKLPLANLGAEGFIIRHVRTPNGSAVVAIAANTDIGVLYGAFAYLRMMQQRLPITDTVSVPRTQLRLLNHWDNLDGSIERGYAGRSIFNWHVLPQYVDPRLIDYARANASIGINGMTPNNVNARADSLSREYIEKTKALADVLRPYGHQGLSVGALERAGRDQSSEDRRSAGPGRERLVEKQGR